MGAGLAEAKLIGGRYLLESLLGAGGMGEVWRARHVALNTSIAIKFLAGTSAQKQSTRKRFLTEAQVTAQLKTRHAVQVFDFGITDEGQPFLVMELLDGETLGHRLHRQGRLDVQSTVRFLEQAARALDRAHGVGIVHRDFKPDNVVIVLDEEGRENVDEFRVATTPEQDASQQEAGEPATPADDICRRCANTSLRHPPCPTEGAGDDGEVYVYAWRALRLGFSTVPTGTTDPKRYLDPPNYDEHVGYDLDCSDHLPDGFPVKCAPIFGDGGPDAQKYPWLPYPKGIDNALGQRFLGPLYVSAVSLDNTTEPLDLAFSKQLEKGKGSILTIVYHWNGTPDDKKVSVRIVSAVGIATANGDVDPNAVPAWDTKDKWVAATAQADPDAKSDQIPLVNSKTDDAYIANGVLVVDYSFLKPLYNHIVNGGVAIEVPLYDMHMVANITKDKLAYQQFFGRWPLENFAAKNDDIAAFLAACDPLKRGALRGALPGLARSAADIPLQDGLPESTPCDALTVTWAADAERASIGGYKAVTSVPTACP